MISLGSPSSMNYDLTHKGEKLKCLGLDASPVSFLLSQVEIFPKEYKNQEHWRG